MSLTNLRKWSMKIKQFDIWLADLNPQIGTESGKTRPVLIVQTNLLNQIPHPSTIICPITTNIIKESKILRVHLNSEQSDLHEDSDIMIDQIRTIDNRRLIRKLGSAPENLRVRIKENIRIVLDLV